MESKCQPEIDTTRGEGTYVSMYERQLTANCIDFSWLFVGKHNPVLGSTPQPQQKWFDCCELDYSGGKAWREP